MKNTKGTKKFSSRREVGASGTTNFQGYIDTDEYKAELTGSTLYTTVDKMRWSDASVQAALLLCELPIRSAEWDVEPAGDDAQSKEIAEFIKENMFEGLTISWEDTLRQILLMQPYGCMVFEVVYKMTEDGKIGWRKWAPRMPKTIEKWNVDINGELRSILQRAYKKDNFIEVEIPIQKLMVFVNRREGDNYLGTSILRQAYKHWFFRDKYYKIDAVAQERLGIGIPIITLPEGYTDDDYDNAETMGKNLRGHERAYVVIKQGWAVEMMDLKANSLKNPTEMLEHHTREILKSVLAQFADLGSKGGSGTYALSEDQSTLFLQSLDATAKSIEEVINDEIKKLVDYNWNVKKYPKLTHANIGTRDFKAIAEAIQTLTFANVMTPDTELEDYMRKLMKLPDRPKKVTPSSEIKQEQQEVGLEAQKKTADQIGKQSVQKPAQKGQPPFKKAHEYKRELTKAERNVRFDEIRDYMDKAEQILNTKMLSVLNREKVGLISRIEDAVRRKDFADLHNIGWKVKSLYAQTFQEEMKKIFEYGKLKASYEIKKPAPMTTSEINRRITERAFFLANRHEKQMMESLKGIAAVGMMDPQMTDEETLTTVHEGFDRFTSKNVPATSSLITSEGINNGRIFTFDSFKDDLYGYQWSSILDNRTCNYCTSMDGKIIGTEDKAFHEYHPGSVHFGCRCIWVGITKEEINPPPFTGIPEELKPQSMIATWDFKDIDYPLPGSAGRKEMPYGLGIYRERSKK